MLSHNHSPNWGTIRNLSLALGMMSRYDWIIPKILEPDVIVLLTQILMCVKLCQQLFMPVHAANQIPPESKSSRRRH